MFAWLTGCSSPHRGDAEAAPAVVAADAAGRWGGSRPATAYAVFAGWGVPAQRTIWMLVAVVGLRSAGVRWPWPHVLLAAAVIVTAFDPWAMTQPGFWLSFAAVGLLIVSAPAQAGPSPDVAAAVSASSTPWRRWVNSAHDRRGRRAHPGRGHFGLTPLTLVFFQQISLSLFANLIAIPSSPGLTPLRCSVRRRRRSGPGLPRPPCIALQVP